MLIVMFQQLRRNSNNFSLTNKLQLRLTHSKPASRPCRTLEESEAPIASTEHQTYFHQTLLDSHLLLRLEVLRWEKRAAWTKRTVYLSPMASIDCSKGSSNLYQYGKKQKRRNPATARREQKSGVLKCVEGKIK